jgi:hypothetical protein
VVWSAGRLFVLSPDGTNHILHTFDAPEAPTAPNVRNGWWRVDTDAGPVTFTARGCGTCGTNPYKTAGLGRVSTEDIVAGNL